MRAGGPKRKARRASSSRARVLEGKLTELAGDLERQQLALEEQNRALIESQLELELSRDRYAEFFDGAPVSFVLLDGSGLIRDLNLPAVRQLGRSRAGLNGLPFATLLERDDRQAFLAHLAQCRRSRVPGKSFRVELRLIPRGRPPGPAAVELITVPASAAMGARRLYRSVFFDVTERRRSEEMVPRLAAIVESSDDAIMSVDLSGRITTWNRGAELLLGYSREEVLGRPVALLHPPGRDPEAAMLLERIRRGGHISHFETVRLRKDGREVQVSLTVSPVQDAAGRIIGVSKIARDITERKRTEQELQAARDEAERAARAKDDFLAALSHELRTPLNPVLLTASDAATNPEIPPEIRQIFELIRRNVEMEARLIDDLLDLTRISHGKLAMDRRPVGMHRLLRDAIAIVRPEFEQKRLSLKQNLAAGRDVLLGDPVRLQQILWNVLKNAVKFTPEGGTVTVGTEILADGFLAVSVADSGIGMTREELAVVFEAFTQGSHRFGGLGLGLAISKKLVMGHSGRIRAESEGQGKGARFVMEFPLAPADVRPNEPRPTAPAEGGSPEHPPRRILLVEDHEPTRAALAGLLGRRHYVVVAAGSVKEATDLAVQQPCDVLISDIGLPDGTGYDLLKALRRKRPIAGIALTGYGMDADIERSEQSGFDFHLTKPVSVQSLERALAELPAPAPAETA